MKFSVEKVNVFQNSREKDKEKRENIEKTLGVDEIEKNIKRFCTEVLIKEQEVGEGNFSHVFSDTQKNGICYKKIKPGAQKAMSISPHREMEFMSLVHGIDDEVKTPYPLGIASVYIKNNETNRLSLTEVIAMEYFDDATRIEDVIDPHKSEYKKEFPKTFEMNSFFEKLERFIQKMHSTTGIYHRDLFSRNVMIDNKTGNPIVLDFGDASRQPLDENYDPYGRRIYNDTPPKDKDISNMETIKNRISYYLTNKKN